MLCCSSSAKTHCGRYRHSQTHCTSMHVLVPVSLIVWDIITSAISDSLTTVFSSRSLFTAFTCKLAQKHFKYVLNASADCSSLELLQSVPAFSLISFTDVSSAAAADESNMFSLLSHTSKYSQQRSCVLAFHFHVSALQMWFIFRLKATAGVTLNTVHRKKAHSKYEARGLEHILLVKLGDSAC